MIHLESITKTYCMGEHKVHALRGLDIHIAAGEMVAVMGPSGSGKSTLMNILGCLDRPSSGKYLLDGEDVAALSADGLASIRNRKLGFVFQSFNLLQLDSALDNVALPLLYAGVSDPHKKAKEALRRVGLEDRAHHKPSELSGGQRQRVAIARALVTNPPVILADEPTGNLDSKTGEEILKIFTKLHREGTTVLMVTHEHEVAEHCRRLLMIRDGVLEKDERFEPRAADDGQIDIQVESAGTVCAPDKEKAEVMS